MLFARAAGGDCQAEPLLGGTAVFGGVGSPMTHALGIGMQGPVSAAELDGLEEFFRSRASACLIDLCPLADGNLQRMIMERGYRIIEFNNVMARRLMPEDGGFAAPPSVELREARTDEQEQWTRLILRGFMETEALPGEMIEMMKPTMLVGRCLMASIDGRPLAGAAVGFQLRTAMFYGDATLAEARGLGLQSALIRYRMALGARLGCDLAMACVVPGTISNRNYERAGFQLVYMRVNVKRDW